MSKKRGIFLGLNEIDGIAFYGREIRKGADHEELRLPLNNYWTSCLSLSGYKHLLTLQASIFLLLGRLFLFQLFHLLHLIQFLH